VTARCVVYRHHHLARGACPPVDPPAEWRIQASSLHAPSGASAPLRLTPSTSNPRAGLYAAGTRDALVLTGGVCAPLGYRLTTPNRAPVGPTTTSSRLYRDRSHFISPDPFRPTHAGWIALFSGGRPDRRRPQTISHDMSRPQARPALWKGVRSNEFYTCAFKKMAHRFSEPDLKEKQRCHKRVKSVGRD
jgi:hypothetical protein